MSAQKTPDKANIALDLSVYYADASLLDDDRLFSELYSSAPEYRREKTDRYRFRKDRNLSLCAEYLLQCLCRDFGIDYGKQTVLLGEHEKPFFANSGVYFNLSHSEERAMCIMSHREVGCDIEKIGMYDMDIAQQAFSQEEISSLLRCRSEEDKALLFYRIWTVKESFIKCIGAGISAPLCSLSFFSEGERRTRFSYQGSEYFLFDGRLDGDYQYALCIRSSADDYASVKNRIRLAEKELLP